MSYGAEKIVKASDLVPSTEEPICVVVGAIAKGWFVSIYYVQQQSSIILTSWTND